MATITSSGVVQDSITRNGRSEPFELQVARNQITGHSAALISGTNAAVSTSQATVWGTGGLYVYPATAQVMKVSSSSTSDTSAGTGARTVVVQGLDASYNQIQETVTLNGQTEVNTVNSYLRVLHLYVATAGTGLAAAGTIYVGTGTVTTGVPAVVYLSYSELNGATSAIWTVPAGYTAYITSIQASSGNATAGQWTKFGLYASATPGAPLDSVLQWITSNGTECIINLPYPPAFVAQTDIEIRAISTVASTSVAANFQIVYVKNDGSL
jgi:hypothetical protein